jgi:TfoX/Sxy family transcriptional regulator of competence genes
MAFDEKLATRIEKVLAKVPHVVQKKMFGGVAFMVRQHMCVGVVDDMLMARVGPDQYAGCLKEKYAKEMTFTGKPMKGMLYIESRGIATEDQLRYWIDKCLDFVSSLPDKKAKG